MKKKDNAPKSMEELDAIAEQVNSTMYKGVGLSAEPPWTMKSGGILPVVLQKKAKDLVRSACFELLEGRNAPLDNDAALYVILTAAAASLRDRLEREPEGKQQQGTQGRTNGQ